MGVLGQIRALFATFGLVATCAGCDANAESSTRTSNLERVAKEASSREGFLEDLPELVEELPVLERRRVLKRWSTDENVELRIAAGRALQSSFVALGASDLVKTLAADPDETVRRHAAVAAMIRRVPVRGVVGEGAFVGSSRRVVSG